MKILKAISGKKALYVVMVLAVLASVMEIVTSLKNGTNIDWQGMTVYWVAIAGWAACLSEQEKKSKQKDA